MSELKKIQHLVNILDDLNEQSEIHTLKIVGNNIMIYPCGSAQVSFGRKENHKNKNKLTPKEIIGNALYNAQIGTMDMIKSKYGRMTYDPSTNKLYFYVSTYNQSLLHKEEHAEHLAKLLEKEFDEVFYYSSREL